MNRTILVAGGGGQVGIEVSRLEWPPGVEIVAPSRDELDIADPDSVADCFDASRPACVINLAAYTAVDKAEQEVASAFLVNAQGPALLAQAANRFEAPIIHVSTDYVFDGSLARPYVETDRTDPLNTYGASKLAGELAVRAANPHSLIIRTAWVLSAHRNNFIKTMLRLADAGSEIRVVADQRGCPTAARDIAAALQLITLRAMADSSTRWGTYHFVNSGETSWYDLAEHVFDWQAAHGRLRAIVKPIATSDYPTPARRPSYSHLDTSLIAETFGIKPRAWQEAVDEILSELASARQTG